ncbi:heavy metal-responsive transcriptional regulator [Arenimonas daejeonensis]|uniref:heavy metal-responsive transcriptional regulator n=1 Tax=Arenimonas daejeonensis TaxID=370777 RepID=UPI0011BDC511|nr:heavy metal-responsive transcriptional regulator [Arenimonas daejeonensis]
MKIGELMKRTGVPIDTIRYYENHGILPPAQRRESGYRDYDEQDVARIRFVRRAKHLGFTLREIRDLLALSRRPDEDMAAVREAATVKLADIEQRIGELQRIRDGLRHLVDACPGHGDRGRCPILAALSTETTHGHA